MQHPRGELGEELAPSSPPSFQQLPVYLESRQGQEGPDAAELTKLRELHARWANV